MKRSHTTQELLNYFDEKDPRVRESSYTIDAQLLNVAAEQMDGLVLRGDREVAARFVSTSPANVDNRGVYYEVRLPSGFLLPGEGEPDPIVEGLRDSVWSPLVRYDDRLPVPARVEYDPDLDGVVASSCEALDVTGSGTGVGGVWDIKHVSPGNLVFPDRLRFWLESVGMRAVSLDIMIEGERHPQPVWASERRKDSENLRISAEGFATSRWAWARVDNITIRNLPAGARLRAWTLPLGMPMVPDESRPFIHSGYRDREFSRYWQIENDNELLIEKYFAGSFGGFEYVQSYKTPEPLVSVAAEPNTSGMWAASASKLYYFDRREPMPANLGATALTREPLYGLTVEYDIERHARTRAVLIKPVAFSRTPQGMEYRYSVEDPDGEHFVLLQDGSLVPYGGSVGWKVDIPKPVRLALLKTGEYVITLETLDRHGRRALDAQPYLNLALQPLVEFDLSDMVPEIQGIAFDHLQRLWVWTGTHLIPLRISYDGFTVDHESSTLYVTDLFEEVRLT